MSLRKREATLRREAKGQGLRLVKRRSRVLRKDALIGGYMLLEADNTIRAGADPIPFSLDLAGVRRALAGPGTARS